MNSNHTSELVSIVLPTYNGSRYIRQSIQSCLDQTYPNWELILVDDGSTDDTPDIIAEYVASDERIRSVRHKQNKKLPQALNTGFSLTRGKYLTWISDDNLYLPQAFAEMVTFLEEHPEVDLVYTDFTYIDEADQPLERFVAPDPDELVWINVVRCCFLYRRKVYEKLGNYSEQLLTEDYDYWLRASAHFQLYPLHKDLCFCRQHEQSLTIQYGHLVLLAIEQTILKNLPSLTWASRMSRGKAYFHLANYARRRKARKAMFKYLLQMVIFYPEFTLTAIRQTIEFVLRSLFNVKKNHLERYNWR